MEYAKKVHLSDTQTGMYLDCAGDENSLKYNVTYEYTFPPETDGPRLAEACSRMLDNYRIVSAGLITENGEPEFVLPEDRFVRCSYEELTEEEYSAFKASTRVPFAFDGSPLSRWHVVKTEKNLYLFYIMHHLILDGTSSLILQDAMEKAYLGKELTPETVTVFDDPDKDPRLQGDPDFAEAIKYYDGLLSGLNGDTCPVPDLPGEELYSCRTENYCLDVPVDRLRAFAKDCGVTENVVLLAAFSYALAKFTGSDSAAFASVNTGRRGKPLENTFGFFVRTFPVRTFIDDSLSVRDFIARVREDYIGSMKHDYLSFSSVAEKYGLKAKVKYVYQGSLNNDFSFNGGTVKRHLMENEEALSDLDLEVKSWPDRIELCANFRAGLYSSENISAFIALYSRVVSEFISAEHLSDIALAPVKGAGLYILDKSGRPLPAFACGELWQCELLPDGGLKPVEKKYDLARLFPDGTLEKIERRAKASAADLSAGAKAPSTGIQRRILKRVAEIMDADNLGIDTDLFDAGLSSLGVIRLNVALAEEFGINLTIKDLRRSSTAEKLEQLILQRTGKASAAAEPDYPLTKNQEGIYIECLSRPDSTTYNVPLLLKSDKKLDAARLKSAIESAVKAHSYLLTELFTAPDGTVRQRKSSRPFEKSEIEEIFSDNADAVKKTLLKPFKLTASRLFRFTLIRGAVTLLFFDVHHIIADGAAVNIFLRDVSRAYAGEELTPEVFTGFDAALEEKNARTAEELSAAKAHYDSIFADVDTDFLPGSDLYPDSVPDRGSFDMPSSGGVAGAAEKFCRDNSVSMNALMLSVFGLVLAKYNAADYSVFTTVYNGRNDSRTADTFAMLVKTLPVFVGLDAASPAELAKKTSRQILDSMVNDIYSFSEINREYGVRSDVMFIYQGSDFGFKSFCGEKAEELPIDLPDKKTPVSLQVFKTDGGFVYRADYDPSRYSEKLIRAIADAFDTALGEFCRRESLADVSLVSPGMLKTLKEFNLTEYPFDESQTMCSLFEKTCGAYPDNTALVFGSRSYTYSALERITAALAKYLADRGIGRGDFVPVLVERNEFMIIGAYGVLRAGAAYEPLDPAYPLERLRFMIEDTGAKLIIADRKLAGIAEGLGAEIIYTDEIFDLPDAPDYVSPAEPDDNFIIVYTSGTTGVPKGNVLSHRQPVALFDFHIRDAKLGPDCRSAYYTGFSFDAGMLDLHASLLSGGTLYVIPEDMRLDLVSMDDYFCENGITHISLTTQMGVLLAKNTKCKTFRYITAGGEKLIPFVPREGLRYVNGYGPSECTVYASEYTVRNDGSLQPVGKPHSNIKFYIIDKNGLRLPAGAAGELCISGKQVGLGYRNRPEKTAEVFTPNPFDNEPGYERMYHTGDIVRMLPDGNYDFVGRRDGQIKIRGFRVELAEIEQVILDYEGIKNVTVQAYDDKTGSKYIAAYVVSDARVDFAALSKYISDIKPSYMVPSAFMQLDSIPLTANGKIDKKSLPQPMKTVESKSSEPADETEEIFCDIFEEVLGLEKVYADDDFFSIGGSSIEAAQAVVKCDAAGFPVVFKNFFENSTPRKLAAFVRGAKKDDILAPGGEEKEKYDYSCLEYNVMDNLDKIKFCGVGDVLLTGVTGFLGAHLYRTLIELTPGRVICLVRKKSGLSAEARFKMMMTYYFEDWYKPEYDSRTVIVDGDLADTDIDEKLSDLSFDSIFNCAANVKHFAAGDSLVNDNFKNVENLISLAEKRNALLVQASSLSVCGESVNGSIPMDFKFKENNLNIGQSLENKYVYSKYLAEQAIIDAVSRGRIRGKIIRFGNLAARESDSEYQINASNSGLMKIMQGYIKLGCYPVDAMDAGIEFSPIDKVAEAMVLLAGTPKEFTVFHAKNCHEIHYAYFINALNARGHKIEIVERDEFETRLKKALDTAEDVTDFTGFIAYLDRTDSSVTDVMVYSDDAANSAEAAKEKAYDVRVRVASDTSYTVKALYRLGFAWPLTSREYLEKMVDALDERAFFGI